MLSSNRGGNAPDWSRRTRSKESDRSGLAPPRCRIFRGEEHAEILGVAPSPNNTKLPMALRFKEIEFEAIPVDPTNRGSVVEVPGHELTPVIADRDVVIIDSEAILQYLDANHRESPRLLPRIGDGRRACDAWKRRLDETVATHLPEVFRYRIRTRLDLDATAVIGSAKPSSASATVGQPLVVSRRPRDGHLRHAGRPVGGVCPPQRGPDQPRASVQEVSRAARRRSERRSETRQVS